MARRAHREYDDIPGTFVFDAEHSRKGYHLNMFCMSLSYPDNRDAFRADEAAYLDKWPMTPEQRQAEAVETVRGAQGRDGGRIVGAALLRQRGDPAAGIAVESNPIGCDDTI